MRPRKFVRLFSVLGCALLLASCAMNQAKREFSYFRGSDKAFDTFEVDVPVDVAHRLVQEGAKRCYAMPATAGVGYTAGVFFPVPGAAVTVESDPIVSETTAGMSTRVGAGNSINYVPMFQVDIVRTPEKSKVTVYYEFRDQKTDGSQLGNVVAWIAGDAAHCVKRRK